MESNDFECISWGTDAVFLNKKFKYLINNNKIKYSIL
jgi:hypothetical protein